MRESWTDERLDDMNRRMEQGFGRVDQDLRLLRTEMNSQFMAVNTRIDSLQRLTIQIGGGMIATFVAGFLGLIAAQLA